MFLCPIKKHRLLMILYDWSKHSHADAVFARTHSRISTRVGRLVEHIVPLHHAERSGKSNCQSFALYVLSASHAHAERRTAIQGPLVSFNFVRAPPDCLFNLMGKRVRTN